MKLNPIQHEIICDLQGKLANAEVELERYKDVASDFAKAIKSSKKKYDGGEWLDKALRSYERLAKGEAK